MLGTIELVAWDGLLIVGAILLICYILALTDIIHVKTSGLKHLFLVFLIVFIIAWIIMRCCYGRRRRRGGPVV
ncbi:hypothetical protein BGZ73_008067 [Actinomortierella ambigua]|nr:hypothetical protein BGZ73_008067 [Actinomortierella ambigua]